MVHPVDTMDMQKTGHCLMTGLSKWEEGAFGVDNAVQLGMVMRVAIWQSSLNR